MYMYKRIKRTITTYLWYNDNECYIYTNIYFVRETTTGSFFIKKSNKFEMNATKCVMM